MKLEKLQEILRKKSIDLAFFAHPDPTVTYLTQYEFSHAYLIINQVEASLYLSKLDKKPRLKDISIRNLRKGWTQEISDKKNIRIGINEENLTIFELNKIRKIFPKALFVDLSPQLKKLRTSKTTTEIKKIKQACMITSQVFEETVEQLKGGNFSTELDVAFYIERRIKEKGADLAFPSIVAMGENAATPHHQTSNEKLGRGFLLMDFGAKYQSYCADMTRVIFLGTISKEEENYYDLLLETQEFVINSVGIGKNFIDLDNLSRKKLGKYSENFIHSLGHGIGVEVHENPTFSNHEHSVEKNVPFTIEPGIYFPGKFGLRIEDTVIFDKEPKILTNATKKLICIERNF